VTLIRMEKKISNIPYTHKIKKECYLNVFMTRKGARGSIVG
jgi:hypothetical protein